MVSQTLIKSFHSAREKQSWFAIWCFALLIGLPLVVGIGTPLILVFPGSSLALGLFLYYRTPHLYIGFAWWMLFLCNLIRRLIDYRSGYITPGPWGFTATLVASISLITVVRYLPVAHRKGGIPFILAFCGIGYAFLIGCTHNPLKSVAVSTLNWICPVAFSFHIFMQWRDYPKIKQLFIKTFLWGVVVMGIYGVLQYVFAPPWEQFYFKLAAASSFGQPVPFGIRIFSSAGAPQPFAALMLSGLIVILCDAANPIIYVASGFGYISFILTMARAVWLSAAISIPLFLLSLKPSHQIRMLLVAVLLLTIVATALLSWEPVYEKFYARFESFFDVEGDVSYNGRIQSYQVLLGAALSQFLGQGVGYSLARIGLAVDGSDDSSIFPLLFTFGWLGLGFYLSGFIMLLIKTLEIPEARSDIFIGACRMVVICIFLQVLFNSVFVNTSGVIIWSFAALGIAGHKYYIYQGQLSRKMKSDFKHRESSKTLKRL